MDLEEKKFLPKIFFRVSEGALLNKLKLFFGKCLYIFFLHPWTIYFLSYQDFKPKNALMLSQQGNLYFEAIKNPNAFFILQKKKF